MKFTKDQLQNWLFLVDELRIKLEDELLWLNIEEIIRTIPNNQEDKDLEKE